MPRTLLAIFPMQTKATLLLVIAAPAVAGLKVQESDPCACLKWKDAYTQYGAVCGTSGRELSSFAPESYKYVQEDFCDKFFSRIDDDFCVNWDIPADTPAR